MNWKWRQCSPGQDPKMLKTKQKTKMSVKEQHLLGFVMGFSTVVASTCTPLKGTGSSVLKLLPQPSTHPTRGLLQPRFWPSRLHPAIKVKQIPLKWKPVKSSNMLIFTVLTDPCQINAPVTSGYICWQFAICRSRPITVRNCKLSTHACLTMDWVYAQSALLNSQENQLEN